MRRIWDILQMEPTTDKRAIKRAYARLTKEIHPEEKPEEFRMLHEAYEKALKYASLREQINGKQVAPEEGEQEVPQYESSGGRTDEGEIPFEEVQAGQRKEQDEQSEYEKLGFGSKAAEKERARLQKIAYFSRWWRGLIIVWANNREMRDEEWKPYLMSEEFREIMWSPIVLEELILGIRKYCWRKEEVLLFFWDLYEMENFEEKGVADVCLQLYKLLYPAYTNRMKRHQCEENREEIKREERRRIGRLVIIFMCFLILLLALIVILAYYEMVEEGPGKVLVGYLLFAVAIFTGGLFWHFIIRS